MVTVYRLLRAQNEAGALDCVRSSDREDARKYLLQTVGADCQTLSASQDAESARVKVRCKSDADPLWLALVREGDTRPAGAK